MKKKLQNQVHFHNGVKYHPSQDLEILGHGLQIRLCESSSESWHEWRCGIFGCWIKPFLTFEEAKKDARKMINNFINSEIQVLARKRSRKRKKEVIFESE